MGIRSQHTRNAACLVRMGAAIGTEDSTKSLDVELNIEADEIWITDPNGLAARPHL